MALYEPVVVTKKGSSLLNRVFLGTKLEFTKMALSSVRNTSTEAETLNSVKQELPVTSFAYEDIDHLNIRAAGNNLELKEGYYARCIGVYAEDPIFGEILLCYTNAEPADFIPAWSPSLGVTDFDLNVVFTIRDSDRVNVIVNDEAWAAQKDLDEAKKARPIRYVLDHLPQISDTDYFLDFIFADHKDLLVKLEALKSVEDIEFIEGDSLYRLLVDTKETGIKNAKEHSSDITNPDDIAIVL